MQADCASSRAVAARLYLFGMTQALNGSMLRSPLWMIRNLFRHKWPYGLKTNFHGSNFIRRAALSRAAETKMPNQSIWLTASPRTDAFDMRGAISTRRRQMSLPDREASPPIMLPPRCASQAFPGLQPLVGDRRVLRKHRVEVAARYYGAGAYRLCRRAMEASITRCDATLSG
jgi:hypothetical protein